MLSKTWCPWLKSPVMIMHVVLKQRRNRNEEGQDFVVGFWLALVGDGHCKRYCRDSLPSNAFAQGCLQMLVARCRGMTIAIRLQKLDILVWNCPCYQTCPDNVGSSVWWRQCHPEMPYTWSPTWPVREASTRRCNSILDRLVLALIQCTLQRME